ncbi:peptidyl-prolyl cis-trans isomerase E isoform X2 [Selaginella moellendorffii]|uniref:peptidyl-prolyl cis-trans isomerase E isoform X1 n=1 Tax=Selaginella moellendorffii TaxID=88036 RepID=UPI000D1CC882|nr:peptidyl-prolyl cis-trans isomerase E isoform X1 [Selaginella moellendorffii]XP_024524945.1 peptidyl-prolyl cis-trans isomerase E isoform X1 [Selaginella moellendorffii]XP_024524946.1 peptidyl-prolyl cis-trans isomerase E isoform X2 [Selaginella moellendorffii]XP_024524947.1 peptidyl-prolyl cis-trans isomerase E isoform X2 [Selaginella moellendorffii]|eukprot:XP_002963980.2 peptidyl-prolyl cis-trans isomerase E isoform X1 [Selaginella moellendorffii]
MSQMKVGIFSGRVLDHTRGNLPRVPMLKNPKVFAVKALRFLAQSSWRMAVPNPKTALYVGGLDENVNEEVLHAAFIPFGDIKDVTMPLDQGTQKHRGFGFVTYLERDDAAAAMDNMHNSELFGKVLTVNYAQPMKIKGGEQGWASQPIWADADTWFERQQRELEMKKLKAEQDATVKAAQEAERKKLLDALEGEVEEPEEPEVTMPVDPAIMQGTQEAEVP